MMMKFSFCLSVPSIHLVLTPIQDVFRSLSFSVCIPPLTLANGGCIQDFQGLIPQDSPQTSAYVLFIFLKARTVCYLPSFRFGR